MLTKFIVFFSVFTAVFASDSTCVDDVDPARAFYKEIRDICHPTQEELFTLQDRLLHTHRPILKRMKETGFIPREFKFIGRSKEETPVSGRLVLNCDEEDRENCIIMYSSFNERYPLGIQRLLNELSHSDYKGHVYYMIGGWPNIEQGDLKLLHVPFAFKPCFFKEVEAKGYKKVLWLDASILPAPGVSLNRIFKMIGLIGFFIQAGDHTIGSYMNPKSSEAFGLNVSDTYGILSCSAAIIGIDFENTKSKYLLNTWYDAAHDPYAFFSDRSDQNALSILIHQQGLKKGLIPRTLLGSIEHSKGHLFIMDRLLVKDK
jgi:hypothetical protein